MNRKAKESLAFPSEPRRKQKKKQNKKRFKTRLLAYIRTIIICFTYFSAVKSPYCLTATCWIVSRGTIIHINVFLANLLVQKLFLNKNHFLEFFSVGCNVAM